MTGMIRKATLLVALGLLAATTAMAGIPSPGNCVFLPFIDVMGTDGTDADPFGTYTVTVKDIGDFAIEGSVVTLNFAAAFDIRICTDFVPVGQTNTCNIAQAITDASGVATFIVAGAANNTGGADGVGLDGVEVRADGYLLGTITAAAYDQNGRTGIGFAGVSGSDESALRTDVGLFGGVGNELYKGRGDLNHDGEISGADVSKHQTLSGYGTSVAGCEYCPD